MPRSLTATVRAVPGIRDERPSHPYITGLIWLAAIAVVTAVATFGFGLHRGDPEGSARVANLEVEALLERGEKVQARVTVSQRLWWDYYRHTYGVLAATERRLVYVGVPPEPLLHKEPGPPELDVQSFPFNRGVVFTRRSALGTGENIRVAAPGSIAQLALAVRDSARLEDVVAVVDRAQTALRTAQDAERRATEAAVAAARKPIYHLVQRGEAVEFIARRYGVGVDSLTRWNNLPDSKIRVGQRLLVRRGQPQ